MRRHPDGSIWLARQNALQEQQYDKEMDRVPGSLRWFPKNTGAPLAYFKNKYMKKVMIIGKGPSLDKLSKEDCANKFVFFINDSMKKANQLGLKNIYVVQQDGSLGNTCIPQSGVHFLSYYARGWNPKATLYKPEELGFSHNSPTIIAAIKICLFMGFTEFDLFAFDALKTNKITDYANIIGYSSSAKRKKPPERFFIQDKMVRETLKGFNWRYM
jgi:hypothetical protein